MSSVDDRIVNMQFNNKQFVSAATETQKSLDGLEKSIANTGNSKGMSALASGVEQVSSRFSALQVAGVAAIATIASKATAAGLHLLKSFTLQPIMDGFQEYQTNLNSIQTVMANTGQKVGVVNKYLNDLNHYSDKTIYNFSQMAQAIGKFTSAGVDLKTATSSIKGMANVAALSGSSADQLNTAMYQMSQALAAGKIQLMDWNSLVNAGMGGKNLQNALQLTAESFGTDVDGMIKKYGSFRESLTQGGWLTTKVFTQTMDAFTGDLSKKQLLAKGYTEDAANQLLSLAKRAMGAAQDIKTLPQLLDVVKESIGSVFSQAFSDILGNFEQSKKLWTGVGNTITNQISSWGKALNVMLLGWQKAGGRSDLIESFANIFGGLIDIAHRVRHAFVDVFPPTTANTLLSITSGFKNFTESIMPSTAVLRTFRFILEAVFAVLHTGFTIVFAIHTAFQNFFTALLGGSDDSSIGIQKLIRNVAKVIIAIDAWITQGGTLVNVLGKAGTVAGEFLSPLIQGLSQVSKAIAALVGGKGVDGFTKHMTKAGEIFASFFTQFANGDLIKEAMDMGGNIIAGITQGLNINVSDVTSAISNVASSIIDTFKDVLGIHSPAAAMVPLGVNIIQGIVQGIETAASYIWDAITGLAGGIKDAFTALFGGMDALDWANLINAVFTGGLVLALTNLTGNFGGILSSLNEMKDSVKEVFGSMTDTLGAMQSKLKAEALKAIAVAVILLAGAALVISLIKVPALVKALTAIGTMLALLVGSLFALGKINAKTNLTLLSASILILSAAMINLAIATTILGKQDMQTLAKGLGAMAITLGLLIGTMLAFSKIQGTVKGAAASILAISIAMNILAAAVLAFGSMDLKTLVTGLTAMAVGLGIVVAGLFVLGKMGSSVASAAASILVVAIAMSVLAASVALFGNMDFGTLVKGLASVAVGLGIMVAALLVLAGVGPEAVVAAAALYITAAAILVMAEGLKVLVGVLQTLGSMDWGTLLKGIAALTLLAVPILAVGAAATAVAPGLLALGISLGLIGAGMFLAGAGMLAFATGFAILATTGVAGVAVLVVAFKAFMALLPSIAVSMAASLVAFLEAIAKAAPRIRAALSKIFAELLGVVKDAIPEITDLVIELMDNIFRVIKNYVSKLGGLFSLIIKTVLKVLRGAIPEIVDAATDIVLALLQGIEDKIPKIAKAATDVVLALLNAIATEYPRLVDGAAKAIVKFINGLSDAIDANAPSIRAAALNLVRAFVDAVTGGLATIGFHAISGAIGDMASKLPNPGGIFGKMSGDYVRKTFIERVTEAVNAAVKMANALIAAGSAEVAKLQDQASKRQGAAFAAQSVADIQAQEAKKADKKSDAADKAQDRADKQADRAQKLADRMDDRAEKAKKEHAAQAKKLADAAKQQEKASKAAKEAAKEATQAAKAQEKAAAAQEKAADKAQKAADKAADAAQKAADKVQDQKDFEAADLRGKADIRTQDAEDNAAKAQQLLAKANAEADEGNKLLNDKIKSNDAAGKALLAQSKDTATQAAKYAAAAQTAQADAANYLAQAKAQEAQEIYTRIANIQAAQQADEDARKAAAEFDAADTAGQIAILDARAQASDDKAAAAQKAAQAYIDQAQATAASDAAAASSLLDQAEAQADIASQAADAADQQRQQAEQLRDQMAQDAASATSDASASTTSGSSSSMVLSQSILDDAARSVDRYTASLAQAEAMAAAASSPVQFVQNNNSPTALTPTEVYRQTKNLLSNAEIKMGVSN